jgi:polyketide synthase PksL
MRSLRSGQCDFALAGGANAYLSRQYYINMSSLRTLSPRGVLSSFGAGADGIVPAEGAGLVLLTRLSRAREDGAPVLAVLRGSAVNHGGHGNGLTVPNSAKQAELIRAALRDAQVGAETLHYIEAHGGGSYLGDPAELRGLSAAFAGAPVERGQCGLGSAKSNIGHTEPAAGVTGLIKVVLALQNQHLPPTLNANPTNPLLKIEETPFRLLHRGEPWQRNGSPRRAGVSSFGLGGTNAHVVVEEGP